MTGDSGLPVPADLWLVNPRVAGMGTGTLESTRGLPVRIPNYPLHVLPPVY